MANAATLRDRDLSGLKLKMLSPMQPGTSVPNFRAEYEAHVRNYERYSKTKRWTGLDTDEYETSTVCTLFSAMPWYTDFATNNLAKKFKTAESINTFSVIGL